MVYERDGVLVDVPLKPEYADYPRRVAEVLDPVAQLEGSSVATLVDDLLQPVGDVLGVRVCSDVNAAGTLPLEDAIRIRQGTKALLLAAAHSAVSAQAFFPRMSRTNAVALVSSVQEGQSQHGSVIARFIVPVEPAVGQMSYLEDPYGRKVMRLLLQALEAVRRVRSLGDYDPLLAMAKEGVSANLLLALASMAPPGKSGAVELSVDWARNRARPGGALSSVRFVSEALAGLDAVAEAMKGQTTTAGFEVEGYVTRLARAPGEANAPGEIIVVPTAGDAVDFRAGVGGARRGLVREGHPRPQERRRGARGRDAGEGRAPLDAPRGVGVRGDHGGGGGRGRRRGGGRKRYGGGNMRRNE